MSKCFLNKTALLLLAGIDISEAALVRLGLINCFIGDEDYDGECGRDGKHYLFLLFKNGDQVLLGKLINLADVKDEYDVGEFTMLVVDWPERWYKEWDLFIDGKYSKFSPEYKEKFTQEAPPLAKKVVRKSGTSNGWLIVNKHEAMRRFQEERIGVPLEDWQEVSSIIDMEEEIFNYERFKALYDDFIRCETNQK